MKWFQGILLAMVLSVLFPGLLLAQQERTRVGVWDFDPGEALSRDENAALSDTLRSELFLTGKYAVVERADMDRILQQKGFQQDGCASTQCIVEAGNLLSVEKMVAGNIGKIGATYTINLRLIDVATGKVEKMARDACRCEIEELIYVISGTIRTLAESETEAEQQARIDSEKRELDIERKLAAAKKPREFSAEGMVLIPEGKFLMGNAEGEGADNDYPQHTVYLDAFYIDTYEVTNAQFKEFVDATHYLTQAERDGWSYIFTGTQWQREKGLNWRHPYGPESGIEDIMNHPVVHVTWNDANAYAEWMGKRLPTEAEWEKAARGVDGKMYPWGNASPDGTKSNYADRNTNYEYSDRQADDGYKYTAPVGKFEADKSPYGVYDMGGNVQEWCSDWYNIGYYVVSPEANPAGPRTGNDKAVRGGGWSVGVPGLLASARWGSGPTFRIGYLGFRCAHDAK